MNEVKFSYGALAPKLEEQANEQGYTLGDKSKSFEKSKESILWLTFRNILTESQKNNAFARLHKQVMKQLVSKEEA
jgi:hypothetical protein